MLDYITIGLYLVAMIGIGIWASKRIHNSKDFSVGNKSIGPFVIICSSIATASGAGTCMGQAGSAYTNGFSALWLVIAWAFGMAMLGVFSKRMYNTGANSVPEIFEKIHNDTAGRVCAIFALVYCFATLTSQMIAMGTVIELMFGNSAVGYQLAVLIGGTITILYTLQGGFYAVAYTDMAQTIILGVCLLIVLPFIIMSGVAETSLEMIDSVMTAGTFDLMDGISLTALAVVICKYTFSACTGIPYIQRVLAARNAKEAVSNQFYAAAGYCIFGGIVMILAVYARVFFPTIDRPETIIVQVIVQKFPVILAGLGISGLIAGVMSTVDSYLLVISQMFSHNICGWFMKDMTDEKEFKIQRITTVVAGVVTMAIALFMTSILTVFEFGATIYSSAMFFPFILSLYWKKITATGTVSGMCVGGIVAIILQMFPIAGTDAVLVGNFTALVATVAVSLATQNSKIDRQMERT
ncbi:MAG: sodium:solute symporter family protein [Eubacteriales bacterium]